MTSTISLIKEWQQALHNEIIHLKKYGSTKFVVYHGRLLSHEGAFTYYFDTMTPLRIPVGSAIKLEWGGVKQSGRVLSSEGQGVILAFEQSMGDLLSEAILFHDPWELLEELISRLDDIKKNKQKRLRVKKLMDPSMPIKHPIHKLKSSIHEVVLRSKYNPITFIWGPPGTGKTYTLARAAANKYFQKKKVLLLAHSNQAVDVLISEITSFLKKKDRFREGDILRYGSNSGNMLENLEAVTTSQLLQQQDPALSQDKEQLFLARRNLKQDLTRSFSKRDTDQLLELETKIAKVLEKIRQKEIEFIADAYIVGTTLAKAASDPAIYEKDFDVVIVDEASMAYVPQAALAASLGKRCIICGDFKQLPPIASSRDALVTKWLKEDIFHHAGVAHSINEGQLHPHLFLLKEQRRMHPDISAFTNRYIYHSLVGDHINVEKSRETITASEPFPNLASVLVDTSFTGAHCMTERTSHSRMNLWQAILSFQLIHESVSSGLISIGYVTPYRAQANLMELILEDVYENERKTIDIIAATVHKFQGSERDVMIFDSVDGDPQLRPGMLLTGKDSERLVNVAITRTKGKFIHVSNQSFIRKHVYQGKTIRQLIEHQHQRQQVVGTREIGRWIQHQHPRLQWMHALKIERVFQDVQNAKSSIVISLPKYTKLTEQWIDILTHRDQGVKLTVISEDFHSELQAQQIVKQSLSFPFILIDRQFFWLGHPVEGGNGVRSPYIAVRLDSAKIANYFLGQFLVEE